MQGCVIDRWLTANLSMLPAAQVVVNLRVVNLAEGVAFWSSSYNFSLPENQLVGATVGNVLASSGSDLFDVAYTLKTHTDLFSVSSSGAIQTRAQLDKEQQEWYILDVEAVDTRSPPTTAATVVRWVSPPCSAVVSCWRL